MGERSDQARAAFARQVRDALEHLYDPVYLQRHPLAEVASAPGAPSPAQRGRALHRRLETGIEALCPAGAASSSGAAARAWRLYWLLRLRYVEALDATQARRRLNLGKTQYYADQQRAVASLATHLWDAFGPGAAGPVQTPPPSGPAGGTRAAAHGGDARRECRPTAEPPGTLPTPLNRFVGRGPEIAALVRLLEGGARLVTLSGPGGIGKTRLALQVADRLAADAGAAWRVRFVDLAPVGEASLVLPAVARALGLRDDGQATLAERLPLAVRGERRLLLVVDNFEHVLGAAPQVAHLLAACPHLTCLVTSRAPLRLAAEQLVPVPPLPMPPDADSARTPEAAASAESDAVALFVERARAVCPGFALSAESAQAVAAVCRRLDGLPLAIELAAAWCRVVPPPALLGHLERRLPLLADSPRDAPARHRTLRDAIAWSYDRLPQAGQALFRRLAVFAGGWSVEAAGAVAADGAVWAAHHEAGAGQQGDGAATPPHPDVLAGLAALADASLIQRGEAGDAARFTMLETIREFGLERAAACGESGPVRRRHAECFLSLVGQAVPAIHSAEQLQWLALLDRESDNIRAALAWCVERATAGDAAAMERGLLRSGQLSRWFGMRGRTAEGLRWLERLLALPGARARTAGRAWALMGAAGMAAPTGRTDPARFEESLAIARDLGDDALAARVQMTQVATHSYAWAGARAAPRAGLEEAVELSGRCGDREGVAGALYLLGNVALVVEGDPVAARAYYARSREAGAPLGDRWLDAVLLRGVGRASARQGDAGTARRLFERALTRHRELGDRLGEADTLGLLGEVARDAADLGAARAAHAAALRIYAEIGALRECAITMERLATVDAARGEAARALRLTGAASAVRVQAGVPPPPHARADIELAKRLGQQALGDQADAAWQTGRGAPIAEAIADALEETSSPST